MDFESKVPHSGPVSLLFRVEASGEPLPPKLPEEPGLSWKQTLSATLSRKCPISKYGSSVLPKDTLPSPSVM